MAAGLSDEDILSMVEEDVDRPLEESLRKLLSKVSDELRDAAFPALDQLEHLDSLEAGTQEIVDYLAEDVDGYRHGAAVFSQKPGEEARAVVAALRSLASWADARLAEAHELAASARRLRDRYLREAAATEELVHHAANEFQSFLCKEMDGGVVPYGEDAEAAARADAVDAAARSRDGVGARFAESYLTLADRLRRAAASTYAEEEEALVVALQRQAAAMEALCADPDGFVAKMLATGSWRCFRAINRLARASGGPNSTQQSASPPGIPDPYPKQPPALLSKQP